MNLESIQYDLAIIGGGPAGVSAGVYASRKRLKTVFIAKEWGGQSIVSDGIENWIGTVKIAGLDLAKNLESHLKAYSGEIVDIKVPEEVTKVEKVDDGFLVKTDKGEYRAKAVLLSAGSHRRKLPAEGADKFEHKGVTYCASCDGPIFSGLDVVVVGGGNAALETCAQLLAYTKSVTLIHRGAEFRADPVTVEKVLSHPNITDIRNSDIVKVNGEAMVTGIVYKDNKTGEEKELATSGIFVEIGSVPTTSFVEGLVDLDEYKRVKIDPWTQKTSVPGIWAAGDCTNIKYHQNNIASGDAVRALEDIYVTLKAK